MADHVHKYAPGPITETASVAVTGGRLVEFTGNRRVGPAGANSVVVAGVAMRDAIAEQTVAVSHIGTHRLRAAAAIAAGGRVVAAAGGEVAPVPTGAGATVDTHNQVVGFAREAIAAGADGLITLTL